MAKHSSAYVIAAAIVAFFLPETFGWVRGDVSSLILGIIMLTMGLTLTTDDFRILFSRPLDIFIGACAQYTLMPLIAYSLVHLFGLSPYLAIGIILVGCCPGGVSSNIMSYLCRGDVAFSVGMTTASTILAPIMTPLLVWWLADTRIEVDTLGMFRGILLITIIPVGCGFLINHWAEDHARSERHFPCTHRWRCGVAGEAPTDVERCGTVLPYHGGSVLPQHDGLPSRL